MEAVFLKILELSFYGSLLILAILPVRLLLQRAPKQMTCLLWAIAAFALICPVRIESPASVLPAVNVEQIVPADTVIRPATAPNTVTVPVEPRPQAAPTVTDTPTVTTEPSRSPAEIASAVWVCGMGLMLLYALWSVLRLKRRVGACLPVGEDVYLCDDIETPFILGIFRPRIYLPSAIDEDTAHQVLLHERAHLKRRDHWWKPLGYVLLTLHWFNPLVWVGYVLLCRDIELACDEKVVRDMAASEKKRYTEALLTCSVPRHMIAACPLAFGEVGVKQRIKAVLNYKKPAFWIIVAAVIFCIALCFGFLTNPTVTTLEELGDVSAEEIESVRIDSDASYHIYEPDALFDTLARLELRPTLLKFDIDGASHLITMQCRENAAIYTLYFSPDCTKLQIIRTVQDSGNSYQNYDSHYRVLNPELLTESDKGSVSTDYLRMDGVPVFGLTPSSVERVYADVTPDNRFAFSDSGTVSAVCALLNSLEFTGERDLAHNNGYVNLKIQMTDESLLLITINAGFTKCDISLYRMVNGVQQGVLFTDSYVIGNPDLVKNSDFIQVLTKTIRDGNTISLADFAAAVEASLNDGSINWSAVTLPDSFLNADELQCVVSYPYWLNDQGETPNDTSLFFTLTYTDDGFVPDYPEGIDINSLILADTPFTVKVTPTGSQESAKLSIRLDPATGEIRSVASLPVEQPAAPADFTAHFRPAPETLRKITVETDSEFEFVTASDISRLCLVLADLQFAVPAVSVDDFGIKNRITLETTDKKQTKLIFSSDFTLVKVIAEGQTSPIYQVLNPEPLQQPEFPQGLYWAEEAIQSTIQSHLTGGGSKATDLQIIHKQIDSNGIYAVVSFDLPETKDNLCLVQLTANNEEFTVHSMTLGQWAGEEGFFPNLWTSDGQSVLWSSVGSNAFDRLRVEFESGKSYLWAVTENAAVYVLPEGEVPVKLTPVNSKGEELAAKAWDKKDFSQSVPVEQPDSSPTAADLQAAIEEHLRNKNRYFANLRILGDAFLDPDNDIYYLLITLDQTRADGTVLSENNLLLVSVIDMGGYLRVDGMVSGTPAQSAGIYPNIAEMNGRLVLWTTRNVNHMKVSEDRLSVISNLSVPNDITKCSIYCENGTVHTWSLMDHGGVFLLPEGDVPISVVPLDAQYNEITALSFNEEYLDPAKARTVSEESGWDVFLNIDSSDLCGYPTVQSFPLYLDMDDSFNAHAALYSAMKECDKLPDIAWSTLELAGTLTYEGYEYAAVRCSEGRDPMALLIEYQTNADGTVTLLNYAKGYVPDEQGFLTGYYMNQSSMSCGAVYWSLFDTRYATSKNGKETNPDKTVEPAFTSFRFTMRDLKTHDFPVEGDFFLAKFGPVIPPAIVTPLEGKTLLAALGSEPMGGLTGTITLSE